MLEAPLRSLACVHCKTLVDQGLQCVNCGQVACVDCIQSGLGVSKCKFCQGVYLCKNAEAGCGDATFPSSAVTFDSRGNSPLGYCLGEDCLERDICWDCVADPEKAQTCSKYDDDPGCGKLICRDCKNRMEHSVEMAQAFGTCDVCGDLRWYHKQCSDCKDVVVCLGCGKALRRHCNNQSGNFGHIYIVV